jgi:hypothetical protein
MHVHVKACPQYKCMHLVGYRACHVGFVALIDGGTSIPPPARLLGTDANDADALEDAYGEYVARCMYSRSWQHRQAAIRYITQRVATGVEAPDVRPLMKYVVKGLNDKVAAVVADSVAMLRAGVERGGRHAPMVVHAVFGALTARLGDNNARVAVRFHCCHCFCPLTSVSLLPLS